MRLKGCRGNSEDKGESIKVSISEGNENIYRKFGFAERLLVMQKRINIGFRRIKSEIC